VYSDYELYEVFVKSDVLRHLRFSQQSGVRRFVVECVLPNISQDRNVFILRVKPSKNSDVSSITDAKDRPQVSVLRKFHVGGCMNRDNVVGMHHGRPRGHVSILGTGKRLFMF
jgi:hypothetical protein